MKERYGYGHRDNAKGPVSDEYPLDWLVYDTVTGRIISDHASEIVAQQQAATRNESRYIRQRDEARDHPNRKIRDKSFLRGQDYNEVVGQIDDAIARFKKQQQ